MSTQILNRPLLSGYRNLYPVLNREATSQEPDGALRLRIAYLASEYPKVSHTFIRREITELVRRGHEVVRLTIRPPATMVDAADLAEAALTRSCLSQKKSVLLAHLAKWSVVQPLRTLRAIRSAWTMHTRSDRGAIRHIAYLAEAAYLADLLRREGISHVHVHFGTNAAAVALLMKKLAGITYSLTIHGPGEFDAPVGLSLAEKVAEAEFTLAISHFCKAQISRWVKPLDWDRVHVVRCTVNPEFLSSPEPIAADADRLVCVGRLTPQKGQLQLIESFAELVQQGLPGKLVLAGDGELRSAIEAAIHRHELENRVEITGWLSESQVREHIRRSRAVVLPSSAEGLPVVLMEALAMGRPVVSTFTAGIPELVRDGENGWLVPAGDRVALGRALTQVMQIPIQRLNEMGLAGRSVVERQHHPAIEGEKLEALFCQYVSQAR